MVAKGSPSARTVEQSGRSALLAIFIATIACMIAVLSSAPASAYASTDSDSQGGNSGGPLIAQATAELQAAGSGKQVFGGHTYQLFEGGVDWDVAKAKCESAGGHLVTITSQKEQDFIVKFMGASDKKTFWLGGQSSGSSGKWITGEDFSYSNWAPGQPDCYQSAESYMQIYNAYNPRSANSIGDWNDITKDNTIPGEEDFFLTEYCGYICEWDVDLLNGTPISKASASVGKMTYNGAAQTPKVTVKLESRTLKQGTDYTVSYLNSKEKAIGASNVKAAGTYYVRIAGIGYYKGSTTKKFTIDKHGMDKKSVTAKLAKSSYPWTGKAIKPAIKVFFNGKPMKKGVDYKVSYLSNKNVGEGTVMVTGMGNFANTTRLFGFKIVKAQQPIKHNLNSDTLKFKYKDVKQGKTFTLTVKNVKEFAPVKVTSTNPKVATVRKISGSKYVVAPKKVGTAKVKIQTTKATKHYAKTTKTITVTVADRKTATITVPKTITKYYKDPAFNLKASCNSRMPITYISSDEDIAKVDKSGRVTLTGKLGTVSIKLSAEGSDYYKAASTNVTIKVVNIQAPIDLAKGGWAAGSYNGHDSGESIQTYATDWQRSTKKNKDADAGMPVYAMADGEIVEVYPGSGSIMIKYNRPLTLTNGYTIKAGHWYSWYGHLRTFKSGKTVKIDNRVKGDKTKKGLTGANKKKKVQAGEIVGYIGKTAANNNHLHFSVLGFNGKIKSIRSSCKPISPFWIAGCGLDNANLYPKTAYGVLHREFKINGVKRNLVKDRIPGKSYWEKE